MKKIVQALAASSLLLLAACGSNGSSGSSEGKEKLVVSTWGFNEDFFREEIYKPFEEENNVEIVLDTGNNADRLNKIKQGNSDVDVIFLSDYYAQQGIQDGLFETIDRENIPNVDKIYDVAKAPLGSDYGPAYTIAQFGIAYNPDESPIEITSWKDLWSADLKGKITIPSITSTTGPMMVDLASQVSGEETFNEDAAFTSLKEIMPSVVKEYGQTSEYVNMFAQGEIAAGPIMEMYFADLKEAVPSAQFVTPAEGGYAVMNTMNVIKGTDQKELSEKFINYILGQEAQEKSAKNKVDSPVNVDVQLTEEEAEGLTYGEDLINSLHTMDMEFVNNNLSKWVDRWNRELIQ